MYSSILFQIQEHLCQKTILKPGPNSNWVFNKTRKCIGLCLTQLFNLKWVRDITKPILFPYKSLKAFFFFSCEQLQKAFSLLTCPFPLKNHCFHVDGTKNLIFLATTTTFLGSWDKTHVSEDYLTRSILFVFNADNNVLIKLKPMPRAVSVLNDRT